MTRTPPRLPVPARDQRTLRQPPLSRMTAPASGLAASQVKNSNRSSSDHSLSASATNVGVSANVYIGTLYGKDGYAATSGSFEGQRGAKPPRRLTGCHRGPNQSAANPPSTGITVPVMKSEASEASSTVRPFRSFSLPRRLSGVCSRMYFPALSIIPWDILLGNTPGAIAFTWMLYLPHSHASDFVKLMTPAL